MPSRRRTATLPPMEDARTSAPDDPILSSLNEEQRAAVVFGDGPLLVLAGAGSGKTRVLTHRLGRLVRDGVPARRILAVTFTNKAADEMKSRAGRLLGPAALDLWIGTFHSICLRLLRRHADRLGFRQGITVFDQEDSQALLKQVLKSRGADDEAPRVRQIQTLISAAKNRIWGPDELEAQGRGPDRAKHAAIYREYQERLRAQDGADFDDLLLLAVRLLEEHPSIGAEYAERFRHVLVDEFQDTNRIQLRLVQLWTAAHGNVMVVGDDDQSIYRWRGADVTNILRFEDHFAGAAVIHLSRNYRSTASILDLATAVVARNRGRRAKELLAVHPAGEKPVLYLARDEEEEARWIGGRITAARAAGTITGGEIAVLYRVHAQSRPLEEAFLDLRLPYVIIGGVAFYQRREVKDLLAYLRLAVNPRDEISFQRAVGAPARGLGTVSLGRIAARAQTLGGDFIEACRSYPDDGGIRGAALAKAREFGELIRDAGARVTDSPAELLRLILARTRFEEWLRESGEPGWEDRLANVMELLAGAERFAARGEVPPSGDGGGIGGDAGEEHGFTGRASVRAYLDQVALYTNLDARAPGEDRVTLMTVHNAKGLEFPQVFLAGLEEGLFPHASSLEDPEELEEERRLFYVGATRAMQRLFLSASLERRRMNIFAAGGLSRFLSEFPAEAVETVRGPGVWVSPGLEPYPATGSGMRRPSWMDRSASRPPRSPRSSVRDEAGDDPSEAAGADAGGDAIEVAGGVAGGGAGESAARSAVRRRGSVWKGRTVRHRIFGVGVVESEDGTGPDARLVVSFPQLGRKKILARFVESTP